MIWSWLAVVGSGYSSLLGNVALSPAELSPVAEYPRDSFGGQHRGGGSGQLSEGTRDRRFGVAPGRAASRMADHRRPGARNLGSVPARHLPPFCRLAPRGNVSLFDERGAFCARTCRNLCDGAGGGLYFSLTTSNFISALTWTLLLQIVLPEVAWMFYGSTVESLSSWSSCLMPAVGQLLVAGLLAWRLWVRLKTRAFVLGAHVG